jgi:hydrogenase maturation factor
MIGIGPKKKLIIPRCGVGDAIIVSKGPAIETTGLMSAYFPKVLEKRFGKEFVKKAQKVYYQMSTVKDASVAASVGGITAMHDATECGVLGGLYEMASHSGVGMNIRLDDIVLQHAVKGTCDCFGIDPYIAISEGTLLATAKKEKAERIVEALKREDIPASVVGEVVPKKDGIHILRKGRKEALSHPRLDPFWVKFEEYLKKQA